MPKSGVARKAAAVAVFVLLLLSAVPAADARYRVGISDQHPDTFGNPLFRQLGLRYGRLVVPYLVHVSMRQQRLEPYRRRVVPAAKGYDDANSFFRAFSRWEGMPPGRWREDYRRALPANARPSNPAPARTPARCE